MEIDRIANLEQRVARIEAQHDWLRHEQLSAEVNGLRQTVEYLVEYIAQRDGATVERSNHVADHS